MTWFLYAEGRRVALAPGLAYRVGRADDADVLIGGSRISRTHLVVTVQESGWELEDRSSNGSFGTQGRLPASSRGSQPLALALGGPDGALLVISSDPNLPAADLATFAQQIAAAGQMPQAPEAATADAPPVLRGDAAPGSADWAGSGPAQRASGHPGFPDRTLGLGPQAGPPAAGAPVVSTGPRGGGVLPERIRIGRAADNDVVVPGLLASLHHAMLVRDGARWQLLDLNSARGTYVNGERVRHAALQPGDEVTLGGSAFTFTGSGLAPRAVAGGIPVAARGITVRIGSATLLNGISFHAEPRTVTAVIGPSGSGKSTLLNALTGLRPATEGQVLVDGGDFYDRYEEMRFWVGAVPQADLVPAQLRVREALEYAARLRFPREASPEARSARVAEVMAELGLTERAELRIDRLSGGQRKRVSVALELLTKPAILYLDEPTSGLDPGLDRQVMMLLRELADGGRTVFVVTHAVENLNLADRLIVLAAGGWLAYDGPPGEVLTYFNAPDMPTVFTTLEATPGQQWALRWAQRAARAGTRGTGGAAGAPAGAAEALGGATGAPGGATGAQSLGGTRAGSAHRSFAKPVGGLTQLPTLISRSTRVIMADRGYVAFLVLLPVILGLAGALVGSSDGLGPGSGPASLNPDARSLLLVIVLGSIFTGAATSIQELVKERVIYQRERAVGLSRAAYVASKGLVLGAIAALQGLIFALLTLLGRPGPADPLVLPAHLEIGAIAALATLCAAMTGLALSAVLPSRETAMPILVVITILQVILSGAIPLRVDWVVDAIGPFTAAFWQFNAMASSVDLAALLGPASDGSWPHEVAEYLTAAGVLGAMTVVLVGAAILLTGRHDPGRG